MQIEQFRDKEGRLWIFVVSQPKFTTNINTIHSHIDVYLSINDIRNTIHIDSFRIPIITEGIKRTWSGGKNFYEIGNTLQNKFGNRIPSFFKIMKNVQDADKRMPVVFSYEGQIFPYSMAIFFDFAKLKFDRKPNSMYFLGARIKNLEPAHNNSYYLFYEDHLLSGIDAQALVTNIKYSPTNSLLIHDHYYLYNDDTLKDNLSNVYEYSWEKGEGYTRHPVKPRNGWNMSVDGEGAPVFYNGSGTIIKLPIVGKGHGISKSVYETIQLWTSMNRYQSLPATGRSESSQFVFQNYLLGEFRSGAAMQSISQSFINDVSWQSSELDNEKLIANNDLGGILS